MAAAPDVAQPWRLTSRGEAETVALGRSFGRRARAGHVFCLVGPLGAGKTAFARGLAEGLGVDAPVTSPTFTLIHRYDGARLPLVHVDAYRLEDPAELAWLGLDDLLAGPAVVVVEWADRVAALLPADALWVTLIPGEQPEVRHVELRAGGPEHARLLGEVREGWRG